MTILGQAEHVVNVERQGEHGDPVPNLERDATMWSAILGVDVTAEQVALCMIASQDGSCVVGQRATPRQPGGHRRVRSHYRDDLGKEQHTCAEYGRRHCGLNS